MDFYKKIFLTFYLANKSTKNLLKKTEHEFIESARDTAFLYVLAIGVFSMVNVKLLIRIVFPDVETRLDVVKLWIALFPPTLAIIIHYFLLTRNGKYKLLIKNGSFIEVNWKKRILVYGLLLLGEFTLAFVLVSI